MTRGFQLHSRMARKTPPQKDRPSVLKPVKRDGKMITLNTIAAKECRWPYYLMEGELVMCGRDIERGSYCADHHQIAKDGRKLCKL